MGLVSCELFFFLSLIRATIAATYCIKRFHLITFKVLNNGPARLANDRSHVYSLRIHILIAVCDGHILVNVMLYTY